MVLDLRPAATVEPRSDLVPDPTAVPTEDDNLYSRFKSLQRQLEFIDIQEEYVKDEQKNLKRELLRAQEEVKRIQSVPLVSGQFMEMVDQNNGIVGSTTGSKNYYVRILSTINWELLKASTSMALHGQSNALVDVLPPRLILVFLCLVRVRNLMLLIMYVKKSFLGGFGFGVSKIGDFVI